MLLEAPPPINPLPSPRIMKITTTVISLHILLYIHIFHSCINQFFIHNFFLRLFFDRDILKLQILALLKRSHLKHTHCVVHQNILHQKYY